MNFRVPPPVLAFATAILMGWLDGRLPGPRLLSTPWSRIGLGLIGIGVFIDAIAVAGFLRARTTVNPLRVDRASKLVVSGLYSWSRNPMYLGLLLALTGWGAILGSFTPFLAIVGFERTLMFLQIGPEERALANQFGADYAAYCARVFRWIGRRRPRSV